MHRKLRSKPKEVTKMNLLDYTVKSIKELVNDKPALASVLHFLGIHFNTYTEKTLHEVCVQRGWDVEQLKDKIKNYLASKSPSIKELNSIPVDLLIEYLKHTHFIFIKQRLPFITELVKNFDGNDLEIKSELKMVFPLFVEDFILHIYEEEDTLFDYILLLHKAENDPSLYNNVQAKMLQNSIKQFQMDHELHEDQLKGLRRMTHDFEILERYDLHTKVVLTELKKLDEELRKHARIENNVLFPKASQMERKILAEVRSKVALN